MDFRAGSRVKWFANYQFLTAYVLSLSIGFSFDTIRVAIWRVMQIAFEFLFFSPLSHLFKVSFIKELFRTEFLFWDSLNFLDSSYKHPCKYSLHPLTANHL